jgi:2'-5' RNA ligase
MRLFVAIPLAPEVIHQLSSLCAHLRSPGDDLRWSTPDTWHITLVFLGDCADSQHSCIASRLRGLSCPSLPIQLDAPGFFDRAGVFFAGVRLTPALLLLQQHVSASAEACGFVLDSRPYRPHITLARSRNHQSLHKLQTRLQHQPAFSSFVAHEFRLYESFLGSGGARHEIRDRFSLVGSTTE